MVYVDAEVCKRICPFCDKETGVCSRALVFRKAKSQVCISNVKITVDKKK